MIIAIIAVILVSSWASIVGLKFLVRNFKAHRFFHNKSPYLPVVPGANIFSGHALSITAPDKSWKVIEDLHEKYGPTFGFYMINHPWVATKDLDLIKLVEIDEAHKHTNRAFLGLPFTEFNNSIWHNDDETWKQVRRVIAPALTNHKVRSDVVTQDIESIVNQLAASMERRSKKALKETGGKSASFELEARDLSERITLATIFLITYKQAGVIDFDAEHDAWVDHMNRASKQIAGPLVYVGMAVPGYRPVCEWLNQLTSSGSMQRKIVKFIERATNLNRVAREQHKKAQEKRHSLGDVGKKDSFSDVTSQGVFRRRLVDTIIDSFFQRKITYDHFVGSLFMMLLAGFMTTADTLTCLLWHLARSPEVQEKLRQTIIEEGIDADYVVWSIYEAIRYHPAVPLGTGRILGEDVYLNGNLLPKGTFVMPTTHGIHHDPKIWPDPERFNPGRWRDQAKFHPAAFVGFGLGPRNCVGAKLALHELKLVLRTLLTTYRVEKCDGTPEKWEFSTPALVFTLHDQPVKVRFVPLREKTAPSAA